MFNIDFSKIFKEIVENSLFTLFGLLIVLIPLHFVLFLYDSWEYSRA